jgi:hypothetical protein
MGASAAFAAMMMERTVPAMSNPITAIAAEVIVPGRLEPGALETAMSRYPYVRCLQAG